MWLSIVVIVLVIVVAIELVKNRQNTSEPIAQPKESEPVQVDICDELNELESKMLKYPNGEFIQGSSYNHEIFGRQEQIINEYYRAGIDIDMDIATQRWKVKE